MVQMRVETEGLEELARRVKDPRIVKRGLARILPRARRAAAKEMKTRIDGGEGKAVRTLFAQYSGARLEMVSGTRMKSSRRALAIEEGRDPGFYPPTRVIRKWMKDVGLPADAKSVAAMKQQIFERGTQGKHYLSGTVEVIKHNLPRWTNDALKTITKSLAKKGLI